MRDPAPIENRREANRATLPKLPLLSLVTTMFLATPNAEAGVAQKPASNLFLPKQVPAETQKPGALNDLGPKILDKDKYSHEINLELDPDHEKAKGSYVWVHTAKKVEVAAIEGNKITVRIPGSKTEVVAALDPEIYSKPLKMGDTIVVGSLDKGGIDQGLVVLHASPSFLGGIFKNWPSIFQRRSQ